MSLLALQRPCVLMRITQRPLPYPCGSLFCRFVLFAVMFATSCELSLCGSILLCALDPPHLVVHPRYEATCCVLSMCDAQQRASHCASHIDPPGRGKSCLAVSHAVLTPHTVLLCIMIRLCLAVTDDESHSNPPRYCFPERISDSRAWPTDSRPTVYSPICGPVYSPISARLQSLT